MESVGPLRVGDLGQILARMSGMLKKQGTLAEWKFRWDSG